MSGGFEDLGLLPELVRATQDQHWILPSDVQDESIPLILGGGDVMVVRLLSRCRLPFAALLSLPFTATLQLLPIPPRYIFFSVVRRLRRAVVKRVPLRCQQFS